MPQIESHGCHFNLSLDEMRKDLIEAGVSLDNYPDKPIAQWIIDHFSIKWCELCSEQFFEENPEIDDVLLVIQYDENQVYKEWLAYRN